MMARCKAKTLDGRLCKTAAIKGQPYCLFHREMPSTGSLMMDRIKKRLRDERRKKKRRK